MPRAIVALTIASYFVSAADAQRGQNARNGDVLYA
jgi:hypothetical protein